MLCNNIYTLLSFQPLREMLHTVMRLGYTYDIIIIIDNII